MFKRSFRCFVCTGVGLLFLATVGLNTFRRKLFFESEAGLFPPAPSTNYVKSFRTTSSGVKTPDASSSDVKKSDTSSSDVKKSDTSSSDVKKSDTSSSKIQTSDTSSNDVKKSDTSSSDVKKSGTSSSDVKKSDTSSNKIQTSDTSSSDVNKSDTSSSDVKKSGTSSSDVKKSDTSSSDVKKSATSSSKIRTSDTSSSDVKKSDTSPSNATSCDDVLNKLLVGRWHQNEMTSTEVETMKRFHKRVREIEHHIPKGVQRADKRCGDDTVGKGGTLFWFRALCDPDGDVPCCFNNHCVNKPVEQCACPNCYDMRTPIQAEYATWRPADPACEEPKGMPVEEICRLLGNSTLNFIGDSLVRHVYTAFLMAIKGDDVSGAFSDNIPQNFTKRCGGIYMFTEKVCRLWLATRTSACKGNVTLKFDEFYNSKYNKETRDAVSEYSRNQQTRSFIFLGVGFHDRVNYDMVTKHLLKPILQALKSEKARWPRLLWATIHKFGLMRTPLDKLDAQAVYEYNQKVKNFLAAWGVPVFDTFNLTDNVMSFDGQHYGFGINRMKVRILLQYFRQLKSQDLRSRCTGIYMFTEKVCRLWLARRTSACEGNVTLMYDAFYFSQYYRQLQDAVSELTRNQQTRSFVLFGVGFHDRLNYPVVTERLLKPMLSAKKSKQARWPRLLWATIHKFGLMRTPLEKLDAQAVYEYNQKVKNFLAPWGVPVFDTFNLTDNVMSFDGQHYGFGINRMKVRILLQYFRQLKSQGLW